MTTVYADEIQPGDVLVYNGNQHQVIRIDRRPGWAWPVAVDASGWAIALGHHSIDVQRLAVRSEAFGFGAGTELNELTTAAAL